MVQDVRGVNANLKRFVFRDLESLAQIGVKADWAEGLDSGQLEGSLFTSSRVHEQVLNCPALIDNGPGRAGGDLLRYGPQITARNRAECLCPTLRDRALGIIY